jgi:hypothetical protein
VVVTAPRTRRWVTTAGFQTGITGQINTALVEGPVTVQRVWVQPSAVVDGGETLRWPWWLWGLQIGALPQSVQLPLLDESRWMVQRVVFMQNHATRPIGTPSPEQLVDLEGQRIVPAGESLFISVASKDASQVTDIIWHARVLVLDP